MASHAECYEWGYDQRPVGDEVVAKWRVTGARSSPEPRCSLADWEPSLQPVAELLSVFAQLLNACLILCHAANACQRIGLWGLKLFHQLVT